MAIFPMVASGARNVGERQIELYQCLIFAKEAMSEFLLKEKKSMFKTVYIKKFLLKEKKSMFKAVCIKKFDPNSMAWMPNESPIPQTTVLKIYEFVSENLLYYYFIDDWSIENNSSRETCATVEKKRFNEFFRVVK